MNYAYSVWPYLNSNCICESCEEYDWLVFLAFCHRLSCNHIILHIYTYCIIEFLNSEARFKFEHCSTKRILSFFPLLLLFLAMHDFLMQSKTFPSYIWNSVFAILTQILRELMEVIFFTKDCIGNFSHCWFCIVLKPLVCPKLHKVI